MESSFEDLDATSTVVKTDRDLDFWFARYFVFRVRIYEKKRKATSAYSWTDAWRAEKDAREIQVAPACATCCARRRRRAPSLEGRPFSDNFD